MTYNDAIKKRRIREQLFFDLAQILAFSAIKSLKNKNPNPSNREIIETIEIALKPNIKLTSQRKSLQQIIESIDTSRWHKNPINSFERKIGVYVERVEIWKTLESTGLSINKSAQILKKGETFRKWARRDNAPNELTRITRNDLTLLEFAAKSIEIFQEMSLKQETEEERKLFLTYAESMETVREFALMIYKIFIKQREEERKSHPENIYTFLGSLKIEAEKAFI